MRSADRPHGFFRPYAEIFAIPRAWRFSLAGIIGRMPMSMYGLGIVMLISAGTGKYALAGSVSAASAFGGAVCAPQLGRLTDRLGQHRMLVPVAVTFTLAVVGLVAAVTLGAPDWTLFPCGIVGGATMPQTGPMVRARWSALLSGSPRLHTAFTLESAADEVCFVVGPAAVTILATQVHPAAGVASAALCAFVGSLWLASQRSTEPPVVVVSRQSTAERAAANEGRGRSRYPRLAAPGLVVLLPAYLFLGTMFIAIDLSTVDFATRLGHKPLAGLLLGCYALGSATGGLWYGSRNWHAPAWQRLAGTLTLTVSGVCTFWAMPNLLVLAPVIYLCGLTIAPTLIAGYSLVESTALPGRATEAMSWLSTGSSVGLAIGSAVVGFILDAFGPRWGYAFAAAAGVIATLIYLGGLRAFSPKSSSKAAQGWARKPRFWLRTCIAVVVAGGMSAAGFFIDVHGVRVGYGLAVVFGGAGVVICLIGILVIGLSRLGPRHSSAETGTDGIPDGRGRYLVGECQDKVQIGMAFSLVARIVLVATPTSTELESFNVPAGGQDVLLVIFAPGLQLLSEQQQTVHVPAHGDSRPVRFELRADVPGLAEMRITAWIGGSHLGELRVEVAAEQNRARVVHRERRAEITTESAAGAVSLVVRYDPFQRAYRFEFRDEDNPGEVVSNMAYDPAPLVEQLVADMDQLVKGRSGYSAIQTREYLVNAGVGLWKQLIPEQLREQFWDRQSRIRQLTILTDKDPVPWELLYPMDSGHDAGFLVEQFPVTRAMFGWRPAHTLSLRPARFVLPEESPREAGTEVEALRRLLDPEQSPSEVIRSLTPLTDLIHSGNFGLLHFACHNTYDPAGGSSIKLGDVRFTPTLLEVAAINDELQRSAPTVFINACRSAGLAARYNRLDGWAIKFLEAGASAFIGSLWAVSDEAAREFAKELYSQLQNGLPLGKAVMQARKEAASKSDDPTWLAYTVYGNPLATIAPSRDLPAKRISMKAPDRRS